MYLINKDYDSSIYRTLKVTFDNKEALKILKEGIVIDKVPVIPEFINRDKYANVNQCFRCFSFTNFTKDH